MGNNTNNVNLLESKLNKSRKQNKKLKEENEQLNFRL